MDVDCEIEALQYPPNFPWRAARRLLTFPEIKWTCLGYGAQSISGSGSGDDGTGLFVVSAKEIIDLGITDPDLFVAMSLFEKKVGPDKISDMTTNVIMRDLLDFNARILPKLGVPLRKQEFLLKNGSSFEAALPLNPCVGDLRRSSLFRPTCYGRCQLRQTGRKSGILQHAMRCTDVRQTNSSGTSGNARAWKQRKS